MPRARPTVRKGIMLDGTAQLAEAARTIEQRQRAAQVQAASDAAATGDAIVTIEDRVTEIETNPPMRDIGSLPALP